MGAELRMVGPAPAGPVALETLRGHVRAPGIDDDDLLAEYLANATAFVEGQARRALRSAQWQLVLDGFPAGDIVLPFGPVSAVDLVSYINASGDTVTLSAEDIRVDLSRIEARISAVDGWPTTSTINATVTVTWTVSGSAVPFALRQAVLLLAGHWYDNRGVLSDGGAQEMPYAVQRLINSERRYL